MNQCNKNTEEKKHPKPKTSNLVGQLKTVPEKLVTRWKKK